MDWSKAKTILIIALVVTDLFLIFTYGFKDKEETGLDEEILLRALADKNIYVEMKIPEKHEDMSVLEVEHRTVDETMVEENLNTVVKGKSPEDLRTAADDFLTRLGIFTDTVTFDRVETEGDTAVVFYKNVRKGISIEESYIKCVFDCSSNYSTLVDFDSYWLNPVRETNRKMHTFSAAESLIAFMAEAPSQEEIHIQNMELIYWLDDSSYEVETTVSDTAFPAWKITYNDGQVMRVNASER